MRERSSRPDRRYAAIPNDAMRDRRLSAEARGALALLMTYSDDWHFQREHLMETLNVGRDKFQKIMRELSDGGYVQLVPVRGDGGHLSGTTWIIRDDPTESLKTRPSAESLKNRQPVKPTAGESAPLRIPTDQENQKKEENQNAGEVMGHDEGQLTLLSEEPEPAKKKPDRFDEFWKVYPKKAGKPSARAAWQKAVKKHDPDKIIEAARVYAQTDQVARGFVKWAQGWLNDERFDDPDLQPRPKQADAVDWFARAQRMADEAAANVR